MEKARINSLLGSTMPNVGVVGQPSRPTFCPVSGIPDTISMNAPSLIFGRKKVLDKRGKTPPGLIPFLEGEFEFTSPG